MALIRYPRMHGPLPPGVPGQEFEVIDPYEIEDLKRTGLLDDSEFEFPGYRLVC